VSNAYPLDVIATGATQSALSDLREQIHKTQLDLLEDKGGCARCRAYDLIGVAVLNQVKTMLRPLALDLGVSAADRHAVALHTQRLLDAVRKGDLYHQHVARILLLYRHYYQHAPTR
jgi:hypothetical protein